MPANGGDVTLAMDMTRGVYTGLKIPTKASSTILIANWESAMNPRKFFGLIRSPKRGDRSQTLMMDQGAKIDWQPLRQFWFTSKAGKRIHNMIALPPNFDENKKYPLLVVMHGGPYSMWRDNWGLRWNYYMLSRPVTLFCSLTTRAPRDSVKSLRKVFKAILSLARAMRSMKAR